MSTYQRIMSYVRPHLGIIFFAALLLTGESSVNLAVPKVLGRFIDSGALTKSLDSLWWVIFVLGVAFFFRYGFTIGHTYLLGRASAKFLRTVRGEVYERLMEARLGFHTDQSVGELTSKLVTDVQILSRIVRFDLASFVTGGLMLVGGTTLLFLTDWRLAVWFFAAVPPVIALVRIIGKKLRSVARTVQRMYGRVSAVAAEHLHTIHTIKAFGNEEQCHEEFGERLDNLLDASLRWVLLQAIFQPAMGLLSFAMFVALAWAGTVALNVGRLSPGALITFLMYAGIVGASATRLAGLYGSLQEALGASDRVISILDAPAERDVAPTTLLPKKLDGRIEIKNVRFSYQEGVPVLKDVSFQVPAGRTVVLVGPSGVGKSTLVNLLLKFYSPNEGTITIDGLDLSKVDRRELRRRIGYVPQNPVLFQGTILSNLLFGVVGATGEAIEKAAKEAYIHDFIMGLPKGYKTPVGEGGVNLSAGQRQRIALARMLLKNPPLMLLDEPTSSLDEESEGYVREVLCSRFAHRTILMVTNKWSMIHIADWVVALRDGQVELQDTPEAFLFRQRGHIVWS